MKQRLCGLVSMLLALFLFHTQVLAEEKGENIVKAQVDELAAVLNVWEFTSSECLRGLLSVRLKSFFLGQTMMLP